MWINIALYVLFFLAGFSFVLMNINFSRQTYTQDALTVLRRSVVMQFFMIVAIALYVFFNGV